MLTSIIPNLSRWLQDSQLVPIIVLMVALLLLMSSMRRRQQATRRRDAAAPVVRPRPEANGSGHLLRRDLDELLVELQDLSRRISAEIDTRFVKLESAMRDADRRIAVLSRLSRPSGGSDPAAKGAAPMLRPGEEADAAGQPDPLPRDQADVRHTVIYELADAGFTPLDIARELGRTPGEVELILNLRRQSHSKT